MKKWCLSLFLVIFFVSSQARGEFYLGYKLSFYNLFSPDFHAFRRNHQFVLGYQNLPAGSSLINMEAQYNWIDDVKGSTSIHTLTAWVMSVEGIFNPVQGTGQIPGGLFYAAGMDTARIRYTYFVNLLSPWLDRGVVNLEYRRLVTSANFLGIARGGIGFSRRFLPVYGINAIYFPNLYTNVNLKFNWLEDGEENPEFLWKFPLSLGFGGRFTSQGFWDMSNIGEGLGLEYIWDPAKSHLVSVSGEKLTHHWLKGYIGNKFLF